MRSLRRRASCVALLALFVALPSAVAADWVRDEVRINLRTGPGTKYRIESTLASGDQVTVLSREESWTQIRLPNGTEGWVPKGYVEAEPPPSVRLPRVERELAEARELIEKLEGRLADQTKSVQELEGLRRRAETLEVENIQVTGRARWKSMGMGAAIVLTGMLLGMGVLSFASRPGHVRGRRIKL